MVFGYSFNTKRPSRISHSLTAMPPVETLRAVVGDDKHDRVFTEYFESFADLLIQPEVVFRNRALIRISRFELHMLFIEIIPESVMHAVEPNINKMKVIPFLLSQ